MLLEVLTMHHHHGDETDQNQNLKSNPLSWVTQGQCDRSLCGSECRSVAPVTLMLIKMGHSQLLVNLYVVVFSLGVVLD